MKISVSAPTRQQKAIALTAADIYSMIREKIVDAIGTDLGNSPTLFLSQEIFDKKANEFKTVRLAIEGARHLEFRFWQNADGSIEPIVGRPRGDKASGVASDDVETSSIASDDAETSSDDDSDA